MARGFNDEAEKLASHAVKFFKIFLTLSPPVFQKLHRNCTKIVQKFTKIVQNCQFYNIFYRFFIII